MFFGGVTRETRGDGIGYYIIIRLNEELEEDVRLYLQMKTQNNQTRRYILHHTQNYGAVKCTLRTLNNHTTI